MAQKQCRTSRPTDITAEILNIVRSLLSQVWDGTSPIRQVGIGLSGFTQEDIVQMTLFEDPKMEFYRKWDMEFDEKMSASEDARLLAYERVVPKDEDSVPDRRAF